jgi:hypothetical protein
MNISNFSILHYLDYSCQYACVKYNTSYFKDTSKLNQALYRTPNKPKA